jgi:spermidine synthase
MREDNRTPARNRVGVIGLGAGTIAAYGRPGDSYRFYEIDPLDISIAKTWFSFLRDSRAHVKVISGDGRLSLEREPSQHFNVLVADAFNGDAVPIQLMTLQAFRLYFSQVAPGGVLAVNVSNRFLNLAPVVARAAGALGKQAIRIEDPGETTERIYGKSIWVLVTGNRQLAAKLARTPHGELLDPNNGTRLWTDDYSNVLASVKALH